MLIDRKSKRHQPMDKMRPMVLDKAKSYGESGVVSDMSDKSRLYAIHSDSECERLEKQAALAGLEEHLRFLGELPAPSSILDAGCGSGSMARLLAARYISARVVGIDLRQDYLTYARTR